MLPLSNLWARKHSASWLKLLPVSAELWMKSIYMMENIFLYCHSSELNLPLPLTPVSVTDFYFWHNFPADYCSRAKVLLNIPEIPTYLRMTNLKLVHCCRFLYQLKMFLHIISFFLKDLILNQFNFYCIANWLSFTYICTHIILHILFHYAL